MQGRTYEIEDTTALHDGAIYFRHNAGLAIGCLGADLNRIGIALALLLALIVCDGGEGQGSSCKSKGDEVLEFHVEFGGWIW